MEPTTDPETPVTSEEPEDSNEVNGAEINAEETVTEYTVSIKDYRKVLNSVTIGNLSDGSSTLDITNDGKITVVSGKTLSMDIAAKEHRVVKSVKSDDKDWAKSSNTYSLKIEADAEVTIEVAETYAFTLDNTGAAGITLQRFVTDAEGVTTKVDFAAGEIEKDGNDLKLITKGYSAANDTLTVSYKADGEDDATAIKGNDDDDPTSTATPKEKVTIYTISADVLASLDDLQIVLVKNEQKAVTFVTGNEVTVQVWGVKTPGANGAADTMDWIEVPSAGYKVIAGEKAKFKAVAKDPYKITAVNASVGDGAAEKVSDASADGTYEFTVTAATEYSFDTEIDSAKSKSLTFNLAGDKGSATAKIKAVTLVKREGDAADVVLDGTTTPTLAAFLTGLGLTDGELTANAEQGVKIPNTVKDITIEVAATAGDYKLSKIDDKAVNADTETAKAERKIDYANIGEIKVETTAEKSAGATFFKINPNKHHATDNPTGVKHIELGVGASTAAGATVTEVEGQENTYQVKEGTDTISIMMTADEGWVLTETFAEALKAKTGVVNVTSEVKDKKTVYTVKLLAKKLDATAGGTSATDLGTIAEAVQVFTAAVDAEASSDEGYVEGIYTVTPVEAFPAEGEADADNIPYNAKLATTITAASGYSLTGVSATMGGTALPAIEVLKVGGTDTAKIEIEKVTGDVKIKVETAPAYSVNLTGKTGTEDPDQPGLEFGDETWAVKYNGKYVVSVSPAVAISDLSAEIKDGETIIGRGKKISGALELWMNRAWAGKELTVDVKAKDVKIGELVLQVNKQRGTLSIKGGNTIKQDVASTVVYEIETDGEKLPTSTDVTVSGALGTARIVDAEINADGNLEVTVKPAKFEDINTVTTKVEDGKTVRDQVIPKTAEILITDPEDSTLKAKATVTANAVFDTITQPSVSLVDGGASDTVLNVSVGMDGVIAPKDRTSRVYYVITAKAKPDVNKTETTEESKRDKEKLEKDTIIKVVPRRGSSQREVLQVAKSNKLGEGAEWGYDVTVKAVYALDGVRPSDSTAAEDVAGSATSDVSALSDKLETGTVTPLFEAALKLKKDSKKKPASTLYTGQSNLYIATPQWSKKDVNYKITEAVVVDLNGWGVNAEIDDAGDLVVTSVDSDAMLGKHTLQVTATADQTTGHTMYASRATITVNVVKGINGLDVITPGNQIYKQNNKPATYKVTPEYDYGWSDEKKVYPKTKKVTWSVVGADSEDEMDSGDIDDFTLTAAPTGITIKNGTITVAKNFTVDARHPKNNSFKVLVQAADFAGNKTAALSYPITVTNEALDVSNIVIAKYDYEKDGYNVIAVKEGTKSAKAQDVKAEEIDGANVYATAKPVNTGFVSRAKWNTLGVVESYNLTYSPAKGKVLTVNSDGEIDVAAPGKKVTITVTTTDGGKKKNSFALNLGYTDADSTAALKITATDAEIPATKTVEVTKAPSKEADAAAKVEKDYILPGVAKLDVTVYVAQRDDKGTFKKFDEANGYQNWKLKVKGGKIASDGNIYTTAKVTTLDLTVGAGKTSKKYTYVLTNTAYEETGKPKVTVKNTLHTSGTEEEQKVKMIALNGKETFGDNKYAKVELDKTAMPKYRTSQYFAWQSFNSAIKSNYIKLNKDTGEFDLEFATNSYDGERVNLTAGSYKMKVTVGEGANAGAFKAKTQPVNVTVKVVKNKVFTFKPTTSYTINKVDGGAVLTGKANVNVKAGEKVKVDFIYLQNANVKGKSNLFTHYFKLDSDPITGTQRIVLNTEDPLVEKLLYETKDDGTIDKTKPYADPDLTSLSKDKANLTGYVTYTAEPSVKYYGYSSNPVTVKITVKIAPEAKNNKYKATQKYVPEGGTEIGLKKGDKTQVNILVNGAYVSVAHAIVDESKAKANAEELAGGVTVNEKGQIVLTAASNLDPEKKGGYSINLLIVPEASFYADAITKATKPEDKKALIERYGTPVKVTVAAKETPKQTNDPSVPKVPVENEKDLAGAQAIVNNLTYTDIEVTKDNDTTLNAASKTAKEAAIESKITAALSAGGYGAGVATLTKSEGLTLDSGNATATMKFNLSVGGETAVVSVTITAKEESAPSAPTAASIAAQVPAKLAGYSIAFSDWTAGSAPAVGTIGTGANDAILAKITGITGQEGFTFTVKEITVTTDPVADTTDGEATVVITVTSSTDPSDTTDTSAITVAIANAAA